MTQSPRALAAQTVKTQREQEGLYQDLLLILDALDHASDHWHQAEQNHRKTALDSVPRPDPAATPPYSVFQRWKQQLQAWLNPSRNSSQNPSLKESPKDTHLATNSATAPEGIDSMTEVLGSAREGVDMIRRSLLDILKQRQVTPLEVLGQPFDPSRMYALGRQEHEEIEDNTVVQEVVRGYVWQNRILREAQVMVAVKPSDSKA
jgi:molecular chaperone GrpE (heat shock protein)